MELDSVAEEIVLRSLREAIPTRWPAKIEELRAGASPAQPVFSLHPPSLPPRRVVVSWYGRNRAVGSSVILHASGTMAMDRRAGGQDACMIQAETTGLHLGAVEVRAAGLSSGALIA